MLYEITYVIKSTFKEGINKMKFYKCSSLINVQLSKICNKFAVPL